jgi:MazG family protein
VEPEPTGPAFARLVRIIGQLRVHCPWMGALTHESLVEYLLEESYELIDAIETGHVEAADAAELKGELGDVLLQVVLHARLQEERGNFAMADVVDGLAEKMIRRNPHVFRPDGSLQESFPATVEEIVRTWQNVKKEERPQRASPFDGIPEQLPALALAAKTLGRARRAGAEHSAGRQPDIGQPDARQPDAEHRIPQTEDDLGDFLFAVVGRAAEQGLDPERALRSAVRRFRQTVATKTPENQPPAGTE